MAFRSSLIIASIALLAAAAQLACGAEIDPAYLNGMKWRQIGPFRGGRVVAVSGVTGDPTTWYFGGVGGGVWKSADVGASWKPVFDAQKISSIGAIAVADSDHNVIYVGTGEACPRGEDFGPTESQRQVYADLHSELSAQIQLWRNITANDLPALQSLMHDHGMPSMNEVGGL